MVSDNVWIGFMVLSFIVIAIVGWITRPKAGDPPD